MAGTLVLTEPLPEAGMRRFASRSDITVAVLPTPTREALAAALPEADGVVMVMEQPALTADLIERAPRLRVACRFGAGYDNFDVPALTRRGIPLATTGSANADAVAEHALYLMLALAKRGPMLDRAVKAGGWPRGPGAVELRDKTCLVIGYGRIGRQIARRAAAFDMQVVIADPNASPPAVRRDGYVHASSLEAGLAEADFAVVACALSPETRGLVNRSTLGRIKPGAFLVNIARGPVVMEAAVVEALASGRLAGAGLDVLETEPPRSDNPLIKRDDVVLTPHTAAMAHSALDRMGVACALNAIAGLDGRLDPANVVNPEVLRPR